MGRPASDYYRSENSCEVPHFIVSAFKNVLKTSFVPGSVKSSDEVSCEICVLPIKNWKDTYLYYEIVEQTN